MNESILQVLVPTVALVSALIAGYVSLKNRALLAEVRREIAELENRIIARINGTYVRRVAEQLGSQAKPGLRLVVSAAARRLALEEDTCLRILEECGYLRKTAPMSLARLIDVPDGLDARETERFLRKRGAEICT